MDADIIPKLRSERALIALSLACALGILAFAGAMGLTASRVAAVIIAVGMRRREPVETPHAIPAPRKMKRRCTPHGPQAGNDDSAHSPP